jgi:hypothetical protein
MLKAPWNHLLCLLAACWPAAARAEFFSDFYAGAAFTQPTSVRVVDESSFPATIVRDDTSIDTSISIGARFGYYLDTAPWFGFAFDMSFFEAEGGPIEENLVFPFSFLFMVRLPIDRSPEFPYGRFQPYGAVGPSFFMTEGEIDLRPAVFQEIDEPGVDLGIDARLGFAWLFHRNAAVFLEYRFTYFRQHLFEEEEFLFGEIDTDSGASFSTHHALIGFSFRY